MSAPIGQSDGRSSYGGGHRRPVPVGPETAEKILIKR